MLRFHLAILVLLTWSVVETPHAIGAQSASSTTEAAVSPANLQAAIDALPKSGGELRLPAGTYEITEPLRLHHGDVKIVGAGTATHIVNKNEAGKPAFVISPAQVELEKNPKARMWRVQIQDLRLTGNPKSGNGLEAVHVDELYVEGVTSSYHGGHGLALIDCYEDPRIIGNLFTYNQKCGVCLENCHDIVVSSNQFEENRDALQCLDSFNLCMNGNNIDDHLQHGIIVENTYGSVISGNMIEECNGTAIVLDRDCYGTTLSSNVIAHHLQGGMDLRDAWGCSVSANTFVLVHQFGIRVSSTSGRLAITGNQFSNSEIGGKAKRLTRSDQPMQRDAGSGVVLDGTRDIVLSGNHFSGLDTPAVQTLGECHHILLHGNMATECAKGMNADQPWFDLRNARDAEAAGNIPRAALAP